MAQHVDQVIPEAVKLTDLIAVFIACLPVVFLNRHQGELPGFSARLKELTVNIFIPAFRDGRSENRQCLVFSIQACQDTRLGEIAPTECVGIGRTLLNQGVDLGKRGLSAFGRFGEPGQVAGGFAHNCLIVRDLHCLACALNPFRNG